MFTMLVGGLWHGASWSFVVWGGLHGLFLVAERLVRPLIPDRPFWRGAGVRAVVMLLTFVAVCFTWVYFRASDFALANALTGAMLGRGETWAGVDVLVAAQALSVQMIGAVIALVVGYHWFMRNRSLEQVAAKIGPVGSSVALGVMMVLVFLSMGGPDRAFIYFQF
jgi:D-alanyl-lipoteichoic acid acyltransferase DltB (MBOAT superfamily)